jgi:hypothetical protein
VIEKLGVGDIGHVDDRGAVRFDLAGERVFDVPAQVAEIEDFAAALVHDEGLIDRPPLVVGVADDLHVPD